jgi:hypothetical protein
VFLVGAGATGSELLKDFAMCGVGTAAFNNVMLVDYDVVEPSNLSRQFLYRVADVGKKKADCAAAAALFMNSNFTVLPKKLIIDEKTPSTLGALCHLSIMALDNDEARNLVARRCQEGYRNPQPFLDLGTEGLRCSTGAYIPNATPTWKYKSKMPDEHSLPCQEKAVPKTIRHCVSFATQLFRSLFVDPLKDAGPLTFASVRDWNDCIIWARLLFDWSNKMWVEDVKHTYSPSDSIWQGRRLPDVVPFDHLDELVQQFVGSAATLKAISNGIQPGPREPKKSIHFASIALAASCSDSTLPDDVKMKQSRSHITKFEKDDDENFHVDFIAACANFRARMFHITPILC